MATLGKEWRGGHCLEVKNSELFILTCLVGLQVISSSRGVGYGRLEVWETGGMDIFWNCSTATLVCACPMDGLSLWWYYFRKSFFLCSEVMSTLIVCSLSDHQQSFFWNMMPLQTFQIILVRINLYVVYIWNPFSQTVMRKSFEKMVAHDGLWPYDS